MGHFQSSLHSNKTKQKDIMNTTEFERDSMAFDVVIVGAGIAGLSAA